MEDSSAWTPYDPSWEADGEKERRREQYSQAYQAFQAAATLRRQRVRYRDQRNQIWNYNINKDQARVDELKTKIEALRKRTAQMMAAKEKFNVEFEGVEDQVKTDMETVEKYAAYFELRTQRLDLDGKGAGAAHRCFDDHTQVATVESSAAEEGQADEVTQGYCICDEPSGGDMVTCGNGQCKPQWFHFACVGLTTAPKGGWVCPGCVTQTQGVGK